MQQRYIHSIQHPRISLHCLLISASLVVGCDPDDASMLDEGEAIIEPLDEIGDSNAVGFDEERQAFDYDQDEDGTPDTTEEIEGTDPLDPLSNPIAEYAAPDDAAASGFPTASCRPGFQNAGARLCISTTTQNAAKYRWAVNNCRNKRSHVCTYEDLTYLYINSGLDATYNPNGMWVGGDLVHDDTVLCGNKSITYNGDPDYMNFEGHCSKLDNRPYWCCHDDE